MTYNRARGFDGSEMVPGAKRRIGRLEWSQSVALNVEVQRLGVITVWNLSTPHYYTSLARYVNDLARLN
jgi:hypothetical protein